MEREKNFKKQEKAFMERYNNDALKQRKGLCHERCAEAVEDTVDTRTYE